MQLIIPEAGYSFDASAKEITLLGIYTGLEVAQVIQIRDLSTSEVLYGMELQEEGISISGGVLTHSHLSSSESQADSDSLMILIDGGGAGSGGIPISIDNSKEAVGYESISIGSSAIGLTAGTYGNAIEGFLTLEDAQIRIRWDGTNPTAGEGHVMDVGDVLRLRSNEDLGNFRAIQSGSGSGVLKATYSE